MFSLTCLVTKIIQAFHSHNRVCKKAYQLYEFNKKNFYYKQTKLMQHVKVYKYRKNDLVTITSFLCSSFC